MPSASAASERAQRAKRAERLRCWSAYSSGFSGEIHGNHRKNTTRRRNANKKTRFPFPCLDGSYNGQNIILTLFLDCRRFWYLTHSLYRLLSPHIVLFTILLRYDLRKWWFSRRWDRRLLHCVTLSTFLVSIAVEITCWGRSLRWRWGRRCLIYWNSDAFIAAWTATSAITSVSVVQILRWL